MHRASKTKSLPSASDNVSTLIGIVVGGSLAIGILGWGMSSEIKSLFHPVSLEERARVEASVYFSGCDEARLAGAAPIHSGQPGYREGMDGDSDGVACEPYY
jgi:hypothetical protein